mmetsp:Transcript_469/g.553  ORF Transcript_469/g.553 Transcript_469/m.553 type:complete len:95 (+) Transcript_469:1112-1396(+)
MESSSFEHMYVYEAVKERKKDHPMTTTFFLDLLVKRNKYMQKHEHNADNSEMILKSSLEIAAMFSVRLRFALQAQKGHFPRPLLGKQHPMLALP